MIYKHVLETVEGLRKVWKKVDDLLNLLSDKIPGLKAVWDLLRTEYSGPVLALFSNAQQDVEAAADAEHALDVAENFLGGAELTNATRLLSDALKFIYDDLLDANQAKLQEFTGLHKFVDEAETTRLDCLQDTVELKSASTGIAAGRMTEAVHHASGAISGAIRDATTYPVLTQEVAYSSAHSSAPQGNFLGDGKTDFGLTVSRAINAVLGWKSKTDDPRGFQGALNASFTCEEHEGHTDCKWTPRSYAVASDLAGGISGAQASLYTRAKEALDLSLPLLDGLYVLDPTSCSDDVDALKKVARNQMTELVAELGTVGGPRSSRVSQYFNLLLGAKFPMTPNTKVENDPDKIMGTLGKLREVLGLNSRTDDFVNCVEDEQDLTNFRILSDYVTSLAQSWVNNLAFFMTPPPSDIQPFFGTQLVLLSRQLSVIAESVEEVRFAMDSVFIGPSERQTLPLALGLNTNNEPFSMYAEDLLSWIQSFATVEGPRLIQDGGKYAVGEAFALQATNLRDLAKAAREPHNKDELPGAYFSGRVQSAWRQLVSQLSTMVTLAKPITHKIEATTAKAVRPLVKAIQDSSTIDELKENTRLAEALMSSKGGTVKTA